MGTSSWKSTKCTHTTFFFVCKINKQQGESVSPSTSVKLVSKLVTPVGNSTVSNMVSSQTVKCHLIKPLVAVTTPSTPFSVKLVPVNTSHVPSLLIWNQPSLMK